MQIYNMESQWRMAVGPGVSVIWEIRQPALDTFAIVSLTKTRHGDRGSGAGGYSGIVSVNGDDLSNSGYPPAAFRRQMRNISVGLVSEGQYAECMITLLREA